MKNRFATHIVHKALATNPIVAIQGAPQVGKSNIARRVAATIGAPILNLENPTTYITAKTNPTQLTPDRPVVFDGIHYVPELLPILRTAARTHPGQFLIVDSAGRGNLPADIPSIVVRPLSQGEIDEQPTPEDFATWICTNPTIHIQTRARDIAGYKFAIALRATRGSMPAPLTAATTKTQARWYRNYMSTLCTRISPDILTRIVRELARTPVTEIIQSHLARKLGITERETHGALLILRIAHILIDLPGWHSAASKRSVSAAKSTLLDTGLNTHNIGFSAGEINLPTSEYYFQQLLEQFVIQQLLIQQTWSTTPALLKHFRTRDGTRVDIVLELIDGRVILIDVITTPWPTKDKFKTMERLKHILGDQVIAGVILHTGLHMRQYHGWQYLLPITMLWQHPNLTAR
ncbi:MAG: DUF4143 domain-containing protein [Corynebacterium sp.]|nr:DUF4143 domain-containing protein [Corynebacterium sp.]